MGSSSQAAVQWIASQMRADQRHWHFVGAFGSGVFVGSAASLAWGIGNYGPEGGLVGLAAIAVGGLVFGIAYRSILVWLGECGAMYYWVLVQADMAPFPPVECTFGMCSETTPPIMLIVGAGAASIAYLVSLLARLLGRSDIAPETGITLGLASSIVLACSAVVLVYSPSESSFAIDTPAGWTPYSVARYNVAPEYGTSYRAALLGGGSIEASKRPMVPMLGVSVVRQELGPRGDHMAGDCLSALDTWGRPSSWFYDGGVATAVSPVIAGAQEVAVSTTQGDRIYGLGVSRMRTVGFMPERLCYIVVVSLPASSTMTSAEVDALFSTLRFR